MTNTKMNSRLDLKRTIKQLEIEQVLEWTLLKGEFHAACESLKPSSLIKETFKDLASSPDFKDNLLGTTVGLAAGGLTKALITGGTHNPLKKILGSLLQIGITTLVAKNPETIKWMAGNIFTFFSRKREAKAGKSHERFV